jgi:anti-sigma factor RsiW
MKCKTIHSKIIFYLDGDLALDEMEQIKLHLSQCNDCAAFAGELSKSMAILESEKSPKINPFFYTRLKAKLENQVTEQNEIYRRPILIKVLQPAFFSILLFVGIYVGIKIGQPANSTATYGIYAEQDLIPYLDEMKNETIETFLME